MQPQPDDTYFVPIIDCPCGQRGPASTAGPYCKDGCEDIYISYCPACERAVLDEDEIVGYVSIEELKAMGWDEAEPDQSAESICGQCTHNQQGECVVKHGPTPIANQLCSEFKID